jgi:hypothetical protein
MKRLFLAPALVAAALASSVPAYAQSTGWLIGSRAGYSADERQSYSASRQAAYDAGFREGRTEGERDGRRGERRSFQDERTYQRADKGYHREFGDIDRYRQSFRTGFAAGYSDAYDRFSGGYRNRGGIDPRRPGTYPDARPGYPGQGGYVSPAFENGRSDGYEKGIEDARKRRSFDPLRHDWYRAGDRHYAREFGAKQQYEDLYRRGFREGYERGFRGGR